jgi:copper chaperone CopZ
MDTPPPPGRRASAARPRPRGARPPTPGAAPAPARPAPPLPAAAPPHGQPHTIVLDVGGMKCGGCSAAVKRMLLGHPGVAAAAVNLLTETAALQVAPGGADPTVLGPQAAELLTSKVGAGAAGARARRGPP